MKRHTAIILLLFCLGTLCLAQGTKEPFDVEKSRQELEIMKGIIRTTLSFVTQDSRQNASGGRLSNIDAFYLAGQGAVFMIRQPGIRAAASSGDASAVLGTDFYQEIDRIAREAAMAAREVSRQAAEVARLNAARLKLEKAKQSAVPPPPLPAPPAPPAAPAPPEPPAAPPVDREALSEKYEDLRKKAKQRTEDIKVNHEKYLENLLITKEYLIEALAKHGDSLTTVKPEEYINFVLLADGSPVIVTNDSGAVLISRSTDRRTRHDVISAQKSWITDYKAGRLTLEAFKARIIQYTE